MKKGLNKLIAGAIKASDKSYFFENYSKQADGVIAQLSRAGFAIVPKEPNDEMVKAGKMAVTIGKTKPNELTSGIYKAMVKSF
jgi:hypothetical protein